MKYHIHVTNLSQSKYILVILVHGITCFSCLHTKVLNVAYKSCQLQYSIQKLSTQVVHTRALIAIVHKKWSFSICAYKSHHSFDTIL